MAGNQNCTDPDNFKYHCVMNELETELVEVCAPQYYIHGTLKMIRRKGIVGFQIFR